MLSEILRGGQDDVHEAGARIVGGHTVIDDELKYGLSVTGRVHPIASCATPNARVGDVLVLTKPIGTGILATAVKAQALSERAGRGCSSPRCRRLNATASRAAVAAGARCATDVTGFGLLGHALHIARASEVTLHIRHGDVPILDGAREALVAGLATGGRQAQRRLGPALRWTGTTAAATCARCSRTRRPQGGFSSRSPTRPWRTFLRAVPYAVAIGHVAKRASGPQIVID